ncbi:MAG: Gfo/Idh/MocA family oxidoreductase [Puniceicoccales bacterium]|nr:Gfo/Idh/MocA family oxidoreductase [Puniceicoccales bacterium]
MLHVGIIGLGSMGMTHLEAYSRLEDVEVSAVADTKFAAPGATLGRAGNLPGQAADAAGQILAKAAKHATVEPLLADPAIEAVDICVPTPLHKTLALAAIRAGKHLLVEKPLARTSADALEITAAANAAGVVLMPAHCMRFWPGWDWLKEAVQSRRHGAVRAATFTRIGAKPPVPFYNDGAASGGAHLDLHIHDADFILHLFGVPKSVSSFGRVGASGAIEHTLTRYLYAGHDAPALVVAEGAWTNSAENRPFVMRYTVDFEHASAVFDLAATPSALTLHEPGRAPTPIPLEAKMGYELEIAEFLRCVRARKNSSIAPPEAGPDSLRLVEAELRSIESGLPEAVK